MKKITLGLLITTAIASGTCLLTQTGAEAKLRVGISDQQPAMFRNPLFKALNVQFARLVVPYDVMSHPKDLATADAWLKGAQADNVRPLIVFHHSNVRRRMLPSVPAYRTAVQRFRQAYPWVKDYSAWNEANHSSQPTFRNPRRAAQYFNAMSDLFKGCSDCQIVALDVLDSSNMASYVQSFKRTARNPRIWGLHNYKDTNRGRSTGTETLLRITKGQVWFTETGGLVKFDRNFPYNPSRAARALQRTISLAKRFRSRVGRVYVYQWTGSPRGARFDAGLINPNGSPRPGYFIFKRELQS